MSLSSGTWTALSPFQDSFKRCLNAKILALAERKALLQTPSSGTSMSTSSCSKSSEIENVKTTKESRGKNDSEDDTKNVSDTEKSGGIAVLVTDRNSPEMSSLPVSLNRYCPVTVVQGSGLLLQGDADLGLVRFQNRFFCVRKCRCTATFHE